jgi:hypothetical protein
MITPRSRTNTRTEPKEPEYALSKVIHTHISIQSLTIIDSQFSSADVLVIAKEQKHQPTIVLENVKYSGSTTIVKEINGSTILPGGGEGTITNWGYGLRSTMESQEPKMASGKFDPAPSSLNELVTGDRRIYFEKSKPQYESFGPERFLSVLEFGVSNTGDTSQIAAQNTIGINKALQAAKGKVLVFPAGRYVVDNTLLIPAGSRLVGVLWSQIIATGPQFRDQYKPKVLAQYVTPYSQSYLR